MRYRVYSGPSGSGELSPLEKERMLFKEFDDFDAALGWARHLCKGGRVPLSIEGDDGTTLNKREIAAALAPGVAAGASEARHPSNRN